MANRRMFSKDVVELDEFLNLPLSIQSVYFWIGMYTDDDGYCGKKKLMLMTKCQQSDINRLIKEGFVYEFDDKILLDSYFHENNLIRKDRKKESKYTKLYPKSIIRQPNDNQVTPKCPHRLGKVSIGKDNKGKKNHLPEWLDKKAWEEYKQHRREIKKKLTPTAEKKQITFLEKHKSDHVEIINQSIRNSWTGLFTLKDSHVVKEPKRSDRRIIE